MSRSEIVCPPRRWAARTSPRTAASGRGSTGFYGTQSQRRCRGGHGQRMHGAPGDGRFPRLSSDLATPGSLSGFTYTADAIRRHGAIASVELSHSGQYAGTYLTDKDRKRGLAQYGPSAGVRPDGLEVKELTKEQLADIAAAYGHCAALAKRAGFEMVMVHGGHGWLINQFLSPYFNHRTDEYGGPLENRVRFAKEVLDSVRKAVGPGFPIEFRMSGSELFEGGYDLEEGVEIAKQLESRVELLHISAGTYQRGFSVTHPSMFRPHGCNVYLAEEIKKHVSVPVATLGG